MPELKQCARCFSLVPPEQYVIPQGRAGMCIACRMEETMNEAESRRRFNQMIADREYYYPRKKSGIIKKFFKFVMWCFIIMVIISIFT